jgi:hypothetical protein
MNPRQANYGVIMPNLNMTGSTTEARVIYFKTFPARWNSLVIPVVFLLWVSGLTTPAWGQALSAATYYASANGETGSNPWNSEDTSEPGTVTATVFDALSSGSATATMNAGDPNEISVSASGSGGYEYFQIAAGATINGTFTILGDPSIMVPVVFLATGQANGNNQNQGASAGSDFVAEDENGPLAVGNANYMNPSFSIDQSVPVVPTVIVSVSMNATAVITEPSSGSPYYPVSGSVSATVDPQIYIDPAFLATNANYSIKFGSGYFMASANIASLNLAGTNIIINATNGVPGGMYCVLTTTNLALPVSQWTPVCTNLWLTPGSYAITATNALSANAPQQFYTLQMQ